MMTPLEFSERPRFVTPKWNVVPESVTVYLNSPTFKYGLCQLSTVLDVPYITIILIGATCRCANDRLLGLSVGFYNGDVSQKL